MIYRNITSGLFKPRSYYQWSFILKIKFFFLCQIELIEPIFFFFMLTDPIPDITFWRSSDFKAPSMNAAHRLVARMSSGRGAANGTTSQMTSTLANRSSTDGVCLHVEGGGVARGRSGTIEVIWRVFITRWTWNATSKAWMSNEAPPPLSGRSDGRPLPAKIEVLTSEIPSCMRIHTWVNI